MPLTKFLDPILNYFAKLAGLEGVQAEDYKGATGGEFLGTVFEFINDMVTKGWLNKAVSAFSALVTGLIVFKGSLDPRTKMELLQFANHLLSRIADAKPRDYQELAESVRDLIDAIKIGDLKLALRSGIRDVEEHKNMLRALGIVKETPITTTGKKTTETRPSSRKIVKFS